MRLVIAAIGRLKDGAERELLGRYRERFSAMGKRLGFNSIVWHELAESRAPTAAKRSAEEGAALLKLVRDADMVIALDEGGKALTSRAFAQLLGKIRDDGTELAAILIGGPDGLGANVREVAQIKLSLSALTLPHGLARIVLAEQLYRAATILAGHPYHRD